ncbi:hypothetical protein [Aliarcobacter skirrowii]|uniref:hypothetical protein n=1 Tax=Aliarcobacter skirrowii TaxID=28200 RepID=UPI000E5CE557|nr:hypothetical protein [Aliarcobacter skirrowii]RJO55093.1 hypothetical protein DIR39_09360 [Aliarcobacter skirrowii]RJO57017.1 hypothetical protein DIR38_09525 [Aliarcobacter skirrowii]
MGFFERLSSEISNMDFINAFIIFLFFYVPFHFSKKAETTIFKLIFSGAGLYLLATMEDIRILYDKNMTVGLGLLIPQWRFLGEFFLIAISLIYYVFSSTYKAVRSFINLIKAFGKNKNSHNENTKESKNDNYSKKVMKNRKNMNILKKNQRIKKKLEIINILNFILKMLILFWVYQKMQQKMR